MNVRSLSANNTQEGFYGVVPMTKELKRCDCQHAHKRIKVRQYIQRHLLGADKSLARPTSRCVFFDAENISFDANLVIYINSNNIPPIVILNRIYEHQNLLSL
jgi:hypothetical protein